MSSETVVRGGYHIILSKLSPSAEPLFQFPQPALQSSDIDDCFIEIEFALCL